MADNTQLNTGSGGDVVASDDISSVKYQRIKLVHGVDGTNDGDVARTNPFPVGAYFSTRSDTYTATANGTQVDVSTKPCSKFSLQIKGTGAAATAWNILLEGSLDGTNYTQILQHSSANPLGADTDGATVWTIAGPFLYFRSRSAATFTLGSATNVVATIVGMQ
jgi:hypothetical protein